MVLQRHKGSQYRHERCATQCVPNTLPVLPYLALIFGDVTVTRAEYEDVTLTPMSSVQHKDWKGDVISDPDKSNPARSRMERPLDTIRSFEAAIDSGHKRKQTARSGTVPKS